MTGSGSKVANITGRHTHAQVKLLTALHMSALGSNCSGVVRGSRIDSSRRPFRASKSNEASGVDTSALRLIAKPRREREKKAR